MLVGWARGRGGFGIDGGGERRGLTEFPAPNFFSVPITAPLRWAALSADFPFTTVSRWAPPPRARLPIFVTLSQSSIARGLCKVDGMEVGSGIEGVVGSLRMIVTCVNVESGLKGRKKESRLVKEYHRICGEAVVAHVCRVIHALSCFCIVDPSRSSAFTLWY